MPRYVRVAVVFALAVAAMPVSTAVGAETRADFEALVPGTDVTDQYVKLGGHGRGVTFGQFVNGAQGPTPTTAPRRDQPSP